MTRKQTELPTMETDAHDEDLNALGVKYKTAQRKRMMSFMGAPLTLGFLGRWRLIEAGVGAGWWWATGAAIITSLAAVFYGGRLIERLYFRRATEATAYDNDVWRFARAPALVAVIVAIACGLAPGLLLDLAARASALALGLAT